MGNGLSGSCVTVIAPRLRNSDRNKTGEYIDRNVINPLKKLFFPFSKKKKIIDTNHKVVWSQEFNKKKNISKKTEKNIAIRTRKTDLNKTRNKSHRISYRMNKGPLTSMAETF